MDELNFKNFINWAWQHRDLILFIMVSVSEILGLQKWFQSSSIAQAVWAIIKIIFKKKAIPLSDNKGEDDVSISKPAPGQSGVSGPQ